MLPCLFCQTPTKVDETNAFWHYCLHHPLASQSSNRIIFRHKTHTLHLDLYFDGTQTTIYLKKPIPGMELLELVPLYSEDNTAPPSYEYLVSLLNRTEKLKAFL